MLWSLSLHLWMAPLQLNIAGPRRLQVRDVASAYWHLAVKPRGKARGGS